MPAHQLPPFFYPSVKAFAQIPTRAHLNALYLVRNISACYTRTMNRYTSKRACMELLRINIYGQEGEDMQMPSRLPWIFKFKVEKVFYNNNISLSTFLHVMYINIDFLRSVITFLGACILQLRFQHHLTKNNLHSSNLKGITCLFFRVKISKKLKCSLTKN